MTGDMMKKKYFCVLAFFLAFIVESKSYNFLKLDFNGSIQKRIVGTWLMMRIPNEYTSVENRTTPWAKLMLSSQKFTLPRKYYFDESYFKNIMSGKNRTKERIEQMRENIFQNLFILKLDGVSKRGIRDIEDMKEDRKGILAYTVVTALLDDNTKADFFFFLSFREEWDSYRNTDYWNLYLIYYRIEKIDKKYFELGKGKDFGEFIYRRSE